MSATQNFIIVGAGLAGASAAQELREQGFDGTIQLIGREPYAPYNRPPLSKGYLQGSENIDAVYVHPESWYVEQRIDLLTDTSVVSVNAAEHTVALDRGDSLKYNKLLLATGSNARALSINGAELVGVHTLRTLDDSNALHELLANGGRKVVLIGAGWIGMEVAATARGLSNDVTVLEHNDVPLAGAIGEELGTIFVEKHRAKGVTVRTHISVESIVGDNGHASGVAIAGGEVIPADVVIVGIGAEPNVALAETAGLKVDNGILVDASLRTSDTDIFAAGDVANAQHPVIGMRLRSEHWANAQNQGAAAARAMLGHDGSFDDIPYFYTDQFDLGMEYSGYGPLTKGAHVVYRGEPNSGEFVAFWLKDSVVVAGMNVNVWDVNDQVQRLIREKKVVDEARLTDVSVPLTGV
ncbi:Ferredoxin reductase [Leifsonia rubra CMS 76R]|nr:Ferredoxin reductase [Leifsonia rubra CMS 76R]